MRDRASPGPRPGPGNVVRGWCPAGERSLLGIPGSLCHLAKLAVIQKHMLWIAVAIYLFFGVSVFPRICCQRL